MFTESWIPQSIRWDRMVYCASADCAALHALPSAGGSEPKRRCLASTLRPLSNKSACTITSIVSGWQWTTTGWGRGGGSALCRCFPNNGTRLCVILDEYRSPWLELFWCTRRLSVCVQSETRTMIHHAVMQWGLRSILGSWASVGEVHMSC